MSNRKLNTFEIAYQEPLQQRLKNFAGVELENFWRREFQESEKLLKQGNENFSGSNLKVFEDTKYKFWNRENYKFKFSKNFKGRVIEK